MDVYVSQSQQLKRNKRKRWRLILAMAVIGGLLVLGWYTIFVSEVFKIKLEFTGLGRLSEEQTKQALVAAVFDNTLSGLLGQDNYLAWPSKINLKEPLIAELTVDKNLLEKKITFHVKEREPFGIWCIIDDCYWFSEDGVLFAPAPITEGNLLLRIDSDSSEKTVLGQPVVADEPYGHIKKIFKFFVENKKPVTRYVLKTGLQEFHARLANGPEIRFSLRFDPKGSLEALTSLLEKPKYKKASYIDLTVENRVYSR